MGCGCGNNNNCNNSTIHYSDLTCLPIATWDEGKYVLGFDTCGQILTLEKPLYELTEEDRGKLDMLKTGGKGNLYLANNGKYQRIQLDQINGIVVSGDGTKFLGDDGEYHFIDDPDLSNYYTKQETSDLIDQRLAP